MKKKDSRRYHDIINLPHHTSCVHPRMSALERAAQFSPFSALTGYEDAIKQSEQFVDERTDISEDDAEELQKNVEQVVKHISEHPKVKLTWFSQEMCTYLTLKERVDKIDECKRFILMKGGTKIPFDDLYALALEYEHNEE